MFGCRDLTEYHFLCDGGLRNGLEFGAGKAFRMAAMSRELGIQQPRPQWPTYSSLWTASMAAYLDGDVLAAFSPLFTFKSPCAQSTLFKFLLLLLLGIHLRPTRKGRDAYEESSLLPCIFLDPPPTSSSLSPDAIVYRTNDSSD
jgi:hypothetical protein